MTINGGGVLTLVGSNTLNSVTLNSHGGNANITLAIGGGLLTLSGSNAISAANDNFATTPTISGGSLAFTSTTPTITTSGLSTNNLIISAPIVSTNGPITKTGAGSVVLASSQQHVQQRREPQRRHDHPRGRQHVVVHQQQQPGVRPLGTGTVTASSSGGLMAGGGPSSIYNPLNVNGSLTFGGPTAANAISSVNGPVTLGSRRLDFCGQRAGDHKHQRRHLRQ